MDISALPKWKWKQPQWLCKCECGTFTTKHGRYLRDGDTQSCGCIEKEELPKRMTIHGRTGTTEYASWQGMKSRCYNENSEKYPDYGARGIKVCDRWLNSFQNFLDDMGVKPSRNHTLDRFPNNETGDYEPSNCRWGTSKEQTRNKRNNHWIEYNGVKMILQDWAAFFKVNSATLSERLSDKKQAFENTYNYYKIKNGF